MAYAAVISLKQTINGLVNSSRIPLVSSCREILESAHNEATSIQKVLERLNDSSSERLDALDGEIREAAHKLEDVLESHESNQLFSQLESYEDEGDDLEEVRQEITSFAKTVKKKEAEYIEELSKPAIPENDIDDLSNYIDFGVEMVGRSSEFTEIRDHLLKTVRPDDMCVFSFVTGRTVYARAIFEDVCKLGKQQYSFDCGALVKIGAEYRLKEVVIRILAQVDNLAGDYELLMSREDDKLREHLYKILEHRRYMIVLDDVRDVQVFDYLRSSFPDRSNGSLVFLTTSLIEVAQSANSFQIFEAYSLEESSWFILCAAFFRADSISPELKEAGKKIAKNCQGCVSLAKTLLFLSKTEKTLEQWSKIAADKENPIFKIGDEISEIREIKTEMQSYNRVPKENGEDSIIEIVSMLIDISYHIRQMKRKMFPKGFFSRMQILSFLGMAGIGKSTFVKRLFKDKSLLCHFDCRAWVTIGPKYRAEEILIDILAQIYPDIDKQLMKEDGILAKDLCAQLSYKRCLIVLDDLWSKEPLRHLKNVFPDIKGTALVTTRQVREAIWGKDDLCFEIKLLNTEESWRLLRQKVFAEGLCPPELEKAGRKIAENCDGLPLLILTVANQLLKVEITPEYWNNVASGKQKSVFMNAHDEISKALLPSYKSLPQHLKACFLYIGVFRNSYEIPTPKLTNMWIAEGFLEPNPLQIVEVFVAECLRELVERNLVMVKRKNSDFQIKTCRLHSVFWHLSNREAVKNKFFHAMNSYVDCSIECIKSQRRLCIRNSILLGMENVQNSMASITTTHSLLCVSPPHQYPVPISFNMRWLRVMDALTIRLYEFPVEVVKLVHLKYLGLTCNGKLPTSISKLRKLQHLIVSRYINIKSSENSSHLPVEIWDMKELKHLQIMGGRLPNPKCGTGLPKLTTLVDVSAQSCTKKVLKRIPNLKRLGIRIELAPDDRANPFRSLNRISRLRKLESLRCVVVNPQLKSEGAGHDPPPPISMFPSSLKKLSLSGFGYPWEYMRIIGAQKLEVLKLKHYAFRGPKWDMDYYSPFSKLKFLLVEDTNLVHWEIQSPVLQQLQRLSIKNCYKLQELPTYLPVGRRFTRIEIVDCNPSTVTWADQMRQRLHPFPVEAHLSWIADSHKESMS